MIVLPELGGKGADLWPALIDIAEAVPEGWVLVGGQMVLLHAIENDAPWPRVSLDLDVIVNARVVAIPAFVSRLVALGFHVDGMSPEGLAHRYRRGDASIDVLAPDGLGSRANLTTSRPGRTLQVPGGTQALQRVELVDVRHHDRTGVVPRPSLLGAIIGKSCAVDVDDAPANQELDLALLLSLVKDPFELRGDLTTKDRQRLRRRRPMLDQRHRVWQSFDEHEAQLALSALAVLIDDPEA